MTVTGAAIGNGWIDPYHQYAAATAAYGFGLIGNAQKNTLDKDERDTCQAKLAKGNLEVMDCFHLMDKIINDSYGKSFKYKVSQYDVRKIERKGVEREFPPGHKIIETYLGGHKIPRGEPPMSSQVSQVLAAIHAEPSKAAGQVYQECTNPPYNALSHQDGLGVVPDVIQCLNEGVKMFFFNGIMDLICNHVGNEILLEKMQWPHQKDWIMAPRFAWKGPLKEGVAGYIKQYQNLSFIKVMDSGHMVPLDVPDVSLEMIKTFMQGGSFQESQQALPRSVDAIVGAALPPPITPATTETAECPVCPECDAVDSFSAQQIVQPQTTGGNQRHEIADFILTHIWLGVILAIVGFSVGFCVNNARGSNNNVRYSSLEMSLSGYKDYDETGRII
eukprot:CAMPEP_0202454968 /NCGR_PEP_ID=MMETSP1360-20130828/12606_1 /ASSEMBLY_ACC=CAM_ASM_000848 /TAXON_ID=515479 /ORGANISM="Licmophora paradoxa, Strain CCMP2313" /LENGTH=388 /DNA_ID=CAMNT_0049074435 /DNA_START=186 /DNA_END=1352 /DNA_ORIENTATION=+